MSTIRSVVTRIFSPFVRAVEGQPRTGWHYLPVSGGWLPPGADVGWRQQGHSLLASDRSAVVERCISLYSQTIASLPGSHWRANDRGGRTRVTNSSLARILKRPNDYQSISDFMLNAVRSLYLEGNCYALAIRNERFEIDEIHLMSARQSGPQIASATGDLFFRLGGMMSFRSGSPLSQRICIHHNF
jgi:hypothetical protein